MRFVASHNLSSLFAHVCVFTGASTHIWMTLQAYAFVHLPVRHSQHLSRAEKKWFFFFFFSCLMLFHVIPHSRCNILLFRNPAINHLNCGWQNSKRCRPAARFLSISNTQVDRNTKEQKLKNALCVDVFRTRLFRWKLAGEWQKKSLYSELKR